MAKFVTKQPRYIGGQYVHASPTEPAVVDLPDGAKVPYDMEPYKGGEVVGEVLKPAFNDAKATPPSSAAVFSAPEPKAASGGKSKRPSDSEVI